MALRSDESRLEPIGNTFLPLGDFSPAKADKYRRHTRAHSYSGYVPYRALAPQAPHDAPTVDSELPSNSPEQTLQSTDYEFSERHQEPTVQMLDNYLALHSLLMTANLGLVTVNSSAFHHVEQLQSGRLFDDDDANMADPETASAASSNVHQPVCTSHPIHWPSNTAPTTYFNASKQPIGHKDSCSTAKGRLVCLSKALCTEERYEMNCSVHETHQLCDKNQEGTSCSQIRCSCDLASDGEAAHQGPTPNHTADTATTLMVRNLPRDISQCQLLNEIESSGFSGLYDFCYMPCDFNHGKGQGFAFINFVSADIAKRFKSKWHRSCRFNMNRGSSCLSVSLAILQGKDANVAKWDNSRSRRVRNPQLRPFIRHNATALEEPSTQQCNTVQSNVPTPLPSSIHGIKCVAKTVHASVTHTGPGRSLLLHKLLP